jgi:hypothetical protein
MLEQLVAAFLSSIDGGFTSKCVTFLIKGNQQRAIFLTHGQPFE